MHDLQEDVQQLGENIVNVRDEVAKLNQTVADNKVDAERKFENVGIQIQELELKLSEPWSRSNSALRSARSEKDSTDHTVVFGGFNGASTKKQVNGWLHGVAESWSCSPLGY